MATALHVIFPGDVINDNDITRLQSGKGLSKKDQKGNQEQDSNSDEDMESDHPDDPTSILKLGPGLLQTELSDILSTRAGILHFRKDKNASQLWVESNSKRYIPAAGEFVLGVVTQRLAEAYRVDIGSSQPALLGHLAFEGATKRNKPNLSVGTVVYARVALANKDMDPELECVNPDTSKADGLGELSSQGSLLPYKISLGYARTLLRPNLASSQSDILSLLGEKIPFECCVGLNGRVWVHAKSPAEMIAIMLAIQQAETLTDEKTIKVLVRDIVRKLL